MRRIVLTAFTGTVVGGNSRGVPAHILYPSDSVAPVPVDHDAILLEGSISEYILTEGGDLILLE